MRIRIVHDLVASSSWRLRKARCPSGKHYALEFRRFRKKAECECARQRLKEMPGGMARATPEQWRLTEFKDHTQLFQE